METQLTLTGVPDYHQADTPTRPRGEVETAVRETLDELAADGLIVGRYKAIGVTLIHTARAVDTGLSSGKISVATAQLTKQLYETLGALPEPKHETGSAYDTLEASIAALTAEALTA